MSDILIAWFGDVVGRSGRRTIAYAAPAIRAESGAQLVIANAENVRHGRGIHPAGYEEIRDAGVDAVTLGDHVIDDDRILPILEDPGQPIAKPVNIEQWASAKTAVTVDAGGVPLHVVSVVGRLFMRFEPGSPFDAIDGALDAITRDDPRALVLVEVHAEATSEKIALVWHCRRRWPENILAVVGTHTHVQTSDARIVDDHLAAVTDLGMCGGRRSVIGFNIDASLERFRGERGTALDVAEEDPVAEGCLIRLDPNAPCAREIRLFRIEIPGPAETGA